MKNFIDGPGTGKTKKLIEYAADNNATIVCADYKKMLGTVYTYGKAGTRVISYSDYLKEKEEEKEKDTKKGPYVIDDIEAFFKEVDPEVLGFTAVI